MRPNCIEDIINGKEKTVLRGPPYYQVRLLYDL